MKVEITFTARKHEDLSLLVKALEKLIEELQLKEIEEA